jgi:hypothetical protein
MPCGAVPGGGGGDGRMALRYTEAQQSSTKLDLI